MLTKPTTDLDQACPEHVAQVLRWTADKFRESAGDLQAAWQDESAGLIWNELAKILDRAAKSCDRACAKFF